MLQNKLFRKLFYFKTWNIGYKDENIDSIQAISSIDNQKFFIKSAADPFYFEFNNKSYILYEKISQITGKGTIYIYDLENNIDQKILSKRYNLSFPTVLEFENKLILFCECAESKKLRYWHLDNSFNLVDEFTVINEGILDPLIIQKEAEYFLIGCKRTGSEQEYESVIYRSLDLNDWIKFDISQIRIPEGMERNAGLMHREDQTIYRFSQLLKPLYGSGVVINKVTKLNNKIYEEIKIKEIKIQSAQNLTGIHTITIAKSGFYYDYRVERFYFFAFILKLSAYVRKKVIKLFPPKT